MAEYRLNLVFTDVDLDDDEVFEALASAPHILWRVQDDVAYATATVEAESATEAALQTVRLVTELAPAARPERLLEDLVSISDIASRVGVSREAVRLWSTGERHRGFPMPRATVGSGIKIWAWSDVNGWLGRNLALAEEVAFPSPHEIALVNSMFADRAWRISPALSAGSWRDVRRMTDETRTELSPPSGSRKKWTQLAHWPKLVPSDGVLYVEAA